MSRRKSTYWYKTRYLEVNQITYTQYLASDHWADLKARFRKSKLCKWKCYICGSRENLNLHHKSYKRIGAEYLQDLVELCRDCHHQVHEIVWSSNSRRKTIFNTPKRLRKARAKQQHNRLRV